MLYLILLAVSAIISITLALYTWRHRQTAGARPFTLMMLSLVVWCVTYLIQIQSPDLASQAFWNKTTYFGIVTTPIFWFLFALEYTERKTWITRARLAALFILPTITILMTWTNGWHHLFWVTDGTLVEEGGVLLRSAENGLWFWVHALYSYCFLLAGTIMIIRALLNWPAQYRGQMIWILLGVFAPWVVNVIQIFKLLPLIIDLTPFAFTLTGAGMAYALFREHLLDLAPMAREVIMEGMRDGLIVLDGNDRIVEVNHALYTILNLPKSQGLIGKKLAEALQPWQALVEESEKASASEVDITPATGMQPHWVERSSLPLRDEKQRVIGRLILIRDISERKQAQDALRIAYDQALEANRAKTQLLAKVSHELRTPLGGILGYAELIRDEVLGEINAEQKDATISILQSTDYLTKMVNELLDEAQMQVNTSLLKERTFSPLTLLQQATAGLDIVAHKKGLTFITLIDPNLPDALYGDAYRLRQILTNLIGNAIKFTESGEVRVRLECRTPQYWLMQVADTGIGIPKEAQASIFEPFKQVENDISSASRGIGLGLSITKQLVDMMGGRIELDSQVGQGSSFKVLLPMHLPRS